MTDELLTAQDQTTLFGDLVADVPAVDRAVLEAALASVMSTMTLDDLVSIIANRYKELLEYIALSQGQRAGQKISLLFNPHRLDTRTSASAMSIFAALRKHPTFHSGLARATLFKQTQYSGGELFYQTVQLGINGVQYVNEFPPHVMRDYCRQYGLNSASKVLDPCAGWGGRLIGASVVVNHYTGYEPSTRTAAGLVKLTDFIRAVKPAFTADIVCEPYEDSVERPAHYDLALTSPPYYDTELYAPDEATQSVNRYGSFNAWCDGFYLPLIDKTMRQLRPGAPFVINIGNRAWPLTDRMLRHCAGRYQVRQLDSRLSQGSTGNKKDPNAGECFFEVRRLDQAESCWSAG